MPVEELINHTFKHSWEDVFLASWRKYPSPKRPEVRSVDIINKMFDKEKGILKTTRLIVCESALPKWLSVFAKCNTAVFLEEAEVNCKTKQMTLQSKNITLDCLIKVEETCTYTIDSENSNWTHLKQIAKATAFTFPVANKVEEFIVNRFKHNAAQGREIMENAIELVKRERELAQQRLAEQTLYFNELTDNLKENLEQSIDGLSSLNLELNLEEDN
jgi:hypothetical protein